MSVTAPEGFRAAGVPCGIKADGALDLGLLTADSPAAAAGVFTNNRAAAPPVLLSRSHLAAGRGISAIVANSGCANAGTGSAGAAAALGMAQGVAEQIGCEVEQVLVASTGPIGPALPLGRVLAGIAAAAARLEASPSAGGDAATAILTTDKAAKEVVVAGPGFTVGGMAKGAGMIRPGMATMLGFLTTDAAADPATLATALQSAVEASFNSLNLDGCESTNDTVVALASGKSGARPDAPALTASLTEACLELAEKMAAGAEGATRMVVIEVLGARDAEAARTAGRAIADSALVRASFHGGDPNWGRLLAAAGASPVDFDPTEFGVAYQGVRVATAGTSARFDEAALLEAMAEGDLDVTVTLGNGPGRARVLTTDLTPEYVRFNGGRS